MSVLLGRAQINVDIIHALLTLEKGLLLDRFGITRLKGRADLLRYDV